MSAFVGPDTRHFRKPVSTASVQVVASSLSISDHTAIPNFCPSSRTTFRLAAAPTVCQTLGPTKGAAISIASGMTLPREVPLASGATPPAAADKSVERAALRAQRASEPTAICRTVNNPQIPRVRLALSAAIILTIPSKLRFAELLTVRISLCSTPILDSWWSSFFTGWPRYTRGFLRSCGALLLKIDSCSGFMS
jgi:hypothetical protein